MNNYRVKIITTYQVSSDTEMRDDELEVMCLMLDNGGTSTDTNGNEVNVVIVNAEYEVRRA
jgi:hypothetical protein